MDNSIDEYMMGYGKTIEVTVVDGKVSVRDHGRGIPLGKVVDVSSKMNTGGKYDSKAFKKSVGLNGVGIKAVNAPSSYFKVCSFRDGDEMPSLEQGNIVVDCPISKTNEDNGTLTEFIPDKSIFKDYQYLKEHIEPLLKNCVFNSGLTIVFNGKSFILATDWLICWMKTWLRILFTPSFISKERTLKSLLRIATNTAKSIILS